jgi:superfamily I DNA and/or RNA helicase
MVRREPVGRRLPEIEELDLFRSRLACEVAAYFLASTIDSVKIEVLTPYVEMKTQIGLMLWQLMGELKEELRKRIKVSTIHSALGSEADIVVVAMGKEYGEYGDKKTIYFQTPELVNVQFSRHRRLLVVIGNIKRLAKGFEKVDYAKNLVRLTEALEELRKQELIKEVTVTVKVLNFYIHTLALVTTLIRNS